LGTRRASRRFFEAIALLLLLVGCSELPSIEANQCGNGVLEPGEDCDRFSNFGLDCRQAGAADACHFDCSDQTDGTHTACPAGFGCNINGACRRKTEEFPSTTTFEVGPVSALATGDFDGDGRQDVLSHEPPEATLQSRFRLHYFDARGSLLETRAFPKLAASPVFSDLDGDHRSDVLFSDFRLGMLRGRSDRAWVPDTFTSYRLPKTALRVVGVNDGEVSAVSGFVTVTSIDGVPAIYVADIFTLKLRSLFELEGRVADIAGRPAAGNLIEGDASPCLELVLGFRGAHDFSMLELCRPRVASDPDFDDEHPAGMPFWLDQARQWVFELPGDVTLDDQAPIVADVDSDGHLDVLIGAGKRPYLVRGDGTGLIPGATRYSLPFAGTKLVDPDIGMPLAAGELSGDAHIDFVLPSGVLSSESRSGSGELSYAPSEVNLGEAWTVAQIGDLNGNGLADVVAASDVGAGVAFFNGTGGPSQIATRLTSNQPVGDIAIGDFNGDQIGDVAFIQKASTDGEHDGLSIAFGNLAAPPSEPLQVGRLRYAQTLASYRQAAFDRLLATSAEGNGGGLTLLDDGVDRLPFAPCTLVNFAHDLSVANDSAIAFSVGAFSRPGATDVLALASPELRTQWAFWLVPDIASDATPLRLSGELPEGASPLIDDSTRPRVSATSSAGDIDGDGVDESIWVLPADGGRTCILAAYGTDAQKGELTPHGSLQLEQPCLDAVVALYDVDSDQHLDLVLLTDREADDQRLEIFWNDGAGAFSTSDVRELSAPDELPIHDFKVMAQGRLGMLFVTDSHLYTADQSSNRREFERPRLRSTLDHGKAVAFADVNGDGPADLVVADAKGLNVLLAELEH
jgi:hypothetical protein